MSQRKLLGPQGLPINKNGIILPGSQEQARKKLSPEQYISRIIRRVEAARRISVEALANIIVALASEGWGIFEDLTVQTSKCEITMVTHLSRDIHGRIQTREERLIRLGADFVPVLRMLAEEQQKAAEKNAEELAAIEARNRKIRAEMGADYDPAEESENPGPADAGAPPGQDGGGA